MELPVEALSRHFIALGASGSGKTVLCKCVVEEAVRNNIPVIIVDSQGDIASLALRGAPEEVKRHGTPLKIQEEFFEKARILIFTPASSKGIPISVNPLRFPLKDTPPEEAILTIDMIATSFASFLGYGMNSDAGKGARAYLFTVLEHFWQNGQGIYDIGHLADIVLNPPRKISELLNSLVTKKEPEEIARKLRFLTVGTPSLMFQMGVKIDIDMFMDCSDGKIPVNIIYLNSLNSSNDKQFFLATLFRELYCWMLKNPSRNVQMLFYVDEIAPYIPPYPRNPPPKEAYTLLFKQARKYGIGLVSATQNVTDIDYKAIAQVNTWCLGRMMTTQDIARVQKIIKSIAPIRAEKVLQKLPALRSGEFLMLSPDFYDDVVDFQVRWLVTNHSILDEKDLPKYLLLQSKRFFEKYLPTRKEKVVITSAPLPIPVEEGIQQFLNSIRKATSADSIAKNLKIDIKDAKKTLQKLIRNGIVKKGRVKRNSEYLYWLSKFRFKPSKNLIGEVLTIPVRITQIKAMRIAKSKLEGGLFGKKEEIYDIEFSYIPIWRILTRRQAKKYLLLKKEQIDTYYLSAQTGAVISLRKKEIIFLKLISEKIDKIKDLDDEKDVTFIPKLPNEVKIPIIKKGKDQIFRMLQLKLGVKPIKAEIVLLPVWTIKVRYKKKRVKRTILIDAVTGRLLSGHFRAS